MTVRKAVAALAAAGAAIAAVLLLNGRVDEDQTIPTFEAMEGPLTIGIACSGSIQSRDKVVLRSELEGKNTILFVVEDGVTVKTGDLLVEFDSASLVEKRNDQEITVNTARGNLIIAEERLEVTKGDCEANLLDREVALTLAKMALEKYEKGDYPQERRQKEADIALADEEMQRAAEKLEWSQKLAKEGFLTRTELQADELALRRKQIDLEMARTKMNVLTNYTVHQERAKCETELRKATRALARIKWQNKSQIRQGETEIIQCSHEYYRATNRLAELEFQISKSKIFAPTNGVVLYAATARRRWWENPLAAGESAVQRQELIYIPLDEGMIVEIMVPESSLNKLETGITANVKVDAFPDRIFHARLMKIGILPDAQSARLNPDLKMFKCELECDFEDAVVRPGMSCDVELVKETYDKVVYCPIQCVTRIDGVSYVYVRNGTQWEPRRVETGLDNNRMIHIVSGLKAGETVMLAPPVKEDKSDAAEGEEDPSQPQKPKTGAKAPGRPDTGGKAPHGRDGHR
ncbi:MAG: efflux transporter periplasmic adaptor subunit [Kiritimatiellae bacterium]|nr:efflux transporter periplasmic adaptor subunit [Kiritimatiellia bacterium]